MGFCAHHYYRLLSGAKSSKWMLGLSTSSIPVGRTFKQKPVLKKSGYFLSFLDEKSPILLTFLKPQKTPILDTQKARFGHYIFTILSTRICIFRSKSMSQYSAKNIKFVAQSRHLYIFGVSTRNYKNWARLAKTSMKLVVTVWTL